MGTIRRWLTQTPNSVSPTLRQTKGQHAEEYAHRYLLKQGLRAITRNFRCKLGEIDLIMQDQDTLVFVEVRYRKNANYSPTLETITPSKQQKILRASEIYLQQHYHHYPPCRYDVVCITGKDLEWIANAFP